MRNLNEVFRKDVNYDNFKSYKKCFACYLQDTFFERPQVG